MVQPIKPISLATNDVKLLAKKGYTVGVPLNSGSFACVCKATYKGKPAAVKVINLEKTSDDYRIKFLPRELYTMKKLRHRHLVKIIDVYVIGNLVLVFMELADGGDFLNLLKETGALSESRTRYYYLQFGDALRYMHDIGFAHRDIKCENILLNKDRTHSKMTDFGFTRSCLERATGRQQLSQTYCGSRPYLAPEVLTAKPYNPMISDVWSMGVVLFVLLQNRLPFKEPDTKKLLAAQLSHNYKWKKTLSNKCTDLINVHLDPNPSSRISMLEVFDHDWFSDSSELDQLD